MSNKVIVNGVDVLKDIEYKENLIKDLKDVVSKQEKLLNQIKEIVDRPHTYIAEMLESSNRYYEIKELIKEKI